MNITWNAEKYTDDFSFVHQYGSGAAELVDCERGSSILDLGCGNGALTKALSEKGFVVAGLDASGELLEIARKNYPELTFLQGDATEFTLENPVDAVFSNAVFHWISKEDQMAMLSCVQRALKPGGQFVFEFGGCGNNARIHQALAQAFAEYGYSYEMPFYFPGIGEYAPMVEKAGFQVRFALLFDRLTELKGQDGLRDWIHMFVKTPFSMIEEEKIREEIISKAVEHLKEELYIDGIWYADYVRIRMKAIRIV